MSQRLCKLSRHDISASLPDIQRIVAKPKYLCRSCARSSADKHRLCKPQALNAVKPLNETLAHKKEQVGTDSKAALKAAKKALKAQKKYHKKLEKVLKKQRKLAKKQQALQAKFSELTPVLQSENALGVHVH